MAAQGCYGLTWGLGQRGRSCCHGHPQEEGVRRAGVKENESQDWSPWRVRKSDVLEVEFSMGVR